MTPTLTLHLGSLRLEQATLRTVYGAITRLSSNEPGLLSSITFDGSTLQLTGVADSGEQVFAKLGDYLGNLPLQKQLESLLTDGSQLSSTHIPPRQIRADRDDTGARPSEHAESLPRQDEAA